MNFLKSPCGGLGSTLMQLPSESSYVPQPLYGGNIRSFCSNKHSSPREGTGAGVKSSIPYYQNIFEFISNQHF